MIFIAFLLIKKKRVKKEDEKKEQAKNQLEDLTTQNKDIPDSKAKPQASTPILLTNPVIIKKSLTSSIAKPVNPEQLKNIKTAPPIAKPVQAKLSTPTTLPLLPPASQTNTTTGENEKKGV